jgi:hypothetical protein
MPGITRPPRRTITDKPGRWEWREDPSQFDLEDSTVDRDSCFTCEAPVGFSLEEGEDERGNARARTPFSLYLISPDGRRRYCEDCAEDASPVDAPVFDGEPGCWHEATAKFMDEAGF